MGGGLVAQWSEGDAGSVGSRSEADSVPVRAGDGRRPDRADHPDERDRHCHRGDGGTGVARWVELVVAGVGLEAVAGGLLGRAADPGAGGQRLSGAG